jgi:ribosomal protein L10
MSSEENSVIEQQLNLIHENLDNFSVEQFQELREKIKKTGFQNQLKR